MLETPTGREFIYNDRPPDLQQRRSWYTTQRRPIVPGVTTSSYQLPEAIQLPHLHHSFSEKTSSNQYFRRYRNCFLVVICVWTATVLLVAWRIDVLLQRQEFGVPVRWNGNTVINPFHILSHDQRQEVSLLLYPFWSSGRPISWPSSRLARTKHGRNALLDADSQSVEWQKGAGYPREINPKDAQVLEQFRSAYLDQMDGDLKRSYYSSEELQDETRQADCRNVPWKDDRYPTCNEFHQIVLERPIQQDYSLLQDYNVTFLSSGGYRDAWKLQPMTQQLTNSNNDLVIKRYRLLKKHNFGAKELVKVHREAIVMEKLSASPHILDIYGYCGTSMLIEAMTSEIADQIVPGKGIVSQSAMNQQSTNATSSNILTPSERLQIALSMAKSLVDLHHYHGGTIVHSDVNIEQWLWNDRGELKLNDFNYAEILPWNEQTQQYCASSAKFDGNFRLVRSPEEFMGKQADESKDIYSFSNMIYSLLTGLWPFYNELYHDADRAKLRKRIYNGKRPFLSDKLRNTNSYMESQLLEIMIQCWNKQPEQRPSMADVTKILEQVKAEAVECGEFVAVDSNWLQIQE